MPRRFGRTAAIAVAGLLALLTLVAYSRVVENGFVGLDDGDYVTDNPRVLAGLTGHGLAWAFTTGHAANWHPLTWLSHMLDVELFGLRAGGHHAMSLAIHLASTLLLYRLMLKMTSGLGASAFVAGVFALHPLHVESVAWVAERKDVLGAFFWILTTLAYVRWLDRPGSGRFALVVLLYALGLCAKPMLVTLPFTLLLLDFWPFRRIHAPWNDLRGVARLAREKLPLFALAAVSCAVTYAVQRSAGAMDAGDTISFGLRAQNAVVACATYLWRFVAPFDLAVFYPLPAAALPLSTVLLAALVVGGLTAFALWSARYRPWLTVGWLWFLGTLVPVLGLVQVGSQATADRYTYLPMIGLSIAVAFGVSDFVRELRQPRVWVATAATIGAALVLGWTALTWRQVAYWRDDAALFGRALEVVPGNYLAHGVLGVGHLRAGRLAEAEAELREAVAQRPNFALGHCNLGAVLERQDLAAEAEAEYETALRLSPRLAEAHHNLGRLVGMQGRTALAIEHLEAALRASPEYVDAHLDLGVALLHENRRAEAIAHLERAVELRPDYEDARRALARARGTP
jgi:hypothetical protein